MKRSGHGDYVNGDVAKTCDKSSLHSVFVVKRVLHRIWNLLLVFWCKLEFTQMVFDSRVTISIMWSVEYSI